MCHLQELLNKDTPDCKRTDTTYFKSRHSKWSTYWGRHQLHRQIKEVRKCLFYWALGEYRPRHTYSVHDRDRSGLRHMAPIHRLAYREVPQSSTAFSQFELLFLEGSWSTRHAERGMGKRYHKHMPIWRRNRRHRKGMTEQRVVGN